MLLTDEINTLLEAKQVELVNIIHKMREDVEPRLIKNIEARLLKQAKDMLAKIKKEGITSIRLYNTQNKSTPIDNNVFMGMIDNGDIPMTYRVTPANAKLKKDHKAWANRWAVRQAGEIVDKFVFKASQKLDGIIVKVGNPKNYKLESFVKDGVLNTHINLEWPSKARFEFRTQIVYGWSVNSKMFSKYPGTFHNVIKGDGSKMKKASEKKMVDTFTV